MRQPKRVSCEPLFLFDQADLSDLLVVKTRIGLPASMPQNASTGYATMEKKSLNHRRCCIAIFSWIHIVQPWVQRSDRKTHEVRNALLTVK